MNKYTSLFRFFVTQYKLRKIKAFIWDVDGTLYQSEKVATVIINYFIKVICRVKKISTQQARNLFFSQQYQHYNWIERVHIITRVRQRELLFDLENNINKSRYLSIDLKLIKKLKEKNLFYYKHFILTNSLRISTLNILKTIGISKDLIYFEKLFTIDYMPHHKPHYSCFQKIIKISNLNPNNILVVGDDLHTDIIPAKKNGMVTCLIGNYNSEYADMNYSSVYDFISNLNNKK